VNPRFAVVVERAATEILSRSLKPLVATDVAAVKSLPSSLQMRLRKELCKKHLHHPFFRLWAVVDINGLRSLCYEAIDHKAFGPGDVVFLARTVASAAFIIAQGRLEYSLDDAKPDQDEKVDLEVGHFLCEPVLWSTWTHTGQALASVGTVCLAINAERFGLVATRNRFFRYFVVEYGKAFHQRMSMNLSGSSFHKPTDIQVLVASLEAILPTMSMESRLLVGGSALRSEHQRKQTRWFANMDEDSLRDEVVGGKCVIMLNEHNDMVRVVALQVVEIQNDLGKVLTELAAWKNDRVVVDVKLPGKKQGGGEMAEIALRRVLQDTLAPFAEFVEPTDLDVEETSSVSKGTSITTKYIKTINRARLTREVELTEVRWEAHAEAQAAPGGTGHIGRVRRSSTIMSFAPEVLVAAQHFAAASSSAPHPSLPQPSNLEVFALANPKGDIFLYAWLDAAEHEHFRSAAGEEHLQKFFDSAKLDSSIPRLARHRFEQISALARSKCEAV